MVIVDRLTKAAHFIPVRTNYGGEKLAKLYVENIVKLHGVPSRIISDRGIQFTSRFLKSLHKAMGTKLDFSSAMGTRKAGASVHWTVPSSEESWSRSIPTRATRRNVRYTTGVPCIPAKEMFEGT